MKNQYFIALLLGLLFHTTAYEQTTISPDLYSIVSYSTHGASNDPTKLFDENEATFWALGNYNLPGEIIIDLGASYDIVGFQITPRTIESTLKPRKYKVYLSTDGLDWGIAEIISDFNFTSTSITPTDIFFGGVTAQFVKMVFETSLNPNGNIQTSALTFYEEPGAVTGQTNQSIVYETVTDKDESAGSFDLDISATSGLPVSLEVVSGPATISGTEVTLTGELGEVVLKSSQDGNAEFYAANDEFITFNVVDMNSYLPTVQTRISEAFPIQMPSLYSYPIYASAEMFDYPELISISSLMANIDGEDQVMYSKDGYYYCWWTPTSYGPHTIIITATTSEGATSSITKNITVTDEIETQIASPMEDVVIIYGGENSRWYTGDISLPQSVGAYSAINANLIVECPDGNCDDWDRAAYIEIKAPGGNWVELIRYMTPYGVACNHTITLSEYESILQGDTEIRMFIDTWGTGGWQITLDLEYVAGTPEYLYSSVNELWDGSYSFGDYANLQPMETREIEFSEDIEKATFILSTTGHGWGASNSENAAEFYHAIHDLEINETPTYTQDLWNDCNPNPDACLGQLGTWQYDRAGWCPGTIAPPNKYDFSSHIPEGSVTLDYVFQESYIDLCHPNHPDCETGVTCEDCNAGYNPFYYIDGHLIKYSNSRLLFDFTGVESQDIEVMTSFMIYPNPNNGSFQVSFDTYQANEPVVVRIFSISGEQVLSSYFPDVLAMENEVFNLQFLESGIYFISIETNNTRATERIVIQ